MTASWIAIARKDVADATRSRMLWGFTLVFVAFLGMALPVAGELFPDVVTVSPAKALAGVAMLAQLFIPGIAIVAGYMAVVGERRTGSLRVLLGAPFTRGRVLAGKLVGRLVVTLVALTTGFAVAAALVVALYGAPTAAAFGGFVATGLLLGVVFTGLAVGGSAATATRGHAMTATIGSFMGMVFFWQPLAAGAYAAVTGGLPGRIAEPWYFLLKRVNPLEAYRVLTEAALDERVDAVPQFPLEDVPRHAPLEQLAMTNRLAGPVPFYLQDWFAALILLAWAVIPVLVGYHRFRTTDLG